MKAVCSKVIFLHESHDVFINYVMYLERIIIIIIIVTKMVKDREYLQLIHLHCITGD